MSGQDHTVTAGGDIQQTAAHTYSSVSGNTTSLYVHEGGIKVFAANGPVSLRAHTDTMQLLADQELTVVSVNEEIIIDAKQRIEVFDGESSLVLEGGDITYLLPGLYSAPMSTHEMMAAGSAQPDLSPLPVGTIQPVPLEPPAKKEAAAAPPPPAPPPPPSAKKGTEQKAKPRPAAPPAMGGAKASAAAASASAAQGGGLSIDGMGPSFAEQSLPTGAERLHDRVAHGVDPSTLAAVRAFNGTDWDQASVTQRAAMLSDLTLRSEQIAADPHATPAQRGVIDAAARSVAGLARQSGMIPEKALIPADNRQGMNAGMGMLLAGRLARELTPTELAARKEVGSTSLAALRGQYGVTQENLVVEAKFEHGGRLFYDVNQTARNSALATEERLPIYSEAKARVGAPNQTFADAHAEIGAMGQSFAEGVRGGHATLTINGKDACTFCVSDVKKMALHLELDSLTVVQPSGTVQFVGAQDFAPIKLGGKKWGN
jgi:hypothetical protein